MKSFVYYTPTEVVFGPEGEEQVGALVCKHGGSRVLVHYGGQSAVRSGLMEKVCRQLEAVGLQYWMLGGVVPNPRLSMVRDGIELVRREGIDFLLAVGGGSVIDSCKAIAYGVPYEGDVWDFFAGKARVEKALPVGVVLTLPASGSEMSDSCVITREENQDKRGYSTPFGRCRFAVMNPERSFTLPAYQTAAGVTDIMMHTLERYFSREDDMDLTDGIAEALLRSMMKNGLLALAHPQDYRARAQIMWGGSLSHNGLTECGLQRDWSCHKMEHALSGLFDVTHGAGLAAIWPSWARYVYKDHLSRFAQFAINVMGVEDGVANAGCAVAEHGIPSDLEAVALKGIEAMEAFFRKMGMPVCMTELLGRKLTDVEITELARRCSRDGSITIGSLTVLHREDMENIYTAANR